VMRLPTPASADSVQCSAHFVLILLCEPHGEFVCRFEQCPCARRVTSLTGCRCSRFGWCTPRTYGTRTLRWSSNLLECVVDP
jgi:hypothetical protein